MSETGSTFARLLDVIALAYSREDGVFAFTRWHADYIAGLRATPDPPSGTRIRAVMYTAVSARVFGDEWYAIHARAGGDDFDAVLFQKLALFPDGLRE